MAIGGFTPLEKVYAFNPIPSELSEAASQYILGAQANVWTEYITSEDHVEYMVFPRILALSEVDWTGPTNNFETDYDYFRERLQLFTERMDALQIKYAPHLGKDVKEAP